MLDNSSEIYFVIAVLATATVLSLAGLFRLGNWTSITSDNASSYATKLLGSKPRLALHAINLLFGSVIIVTGVVPDTFDTMVVVFYCFILPMHYLIVLYKVIKGSSSA